MSIAAEIDKATDLLSLTLHGLVKMGQFLQELDGTLSDPAYHPGMRVLIDLQDAAHGASSGDIADLSDYIIASQAKLAGTRVAIVVTKTVTYGLMRMFQMHVDEMLAVSLFYDMHEAKRWLELPVG